MISAIILSKNEEKNIIDCIDSVRFCDEIIILDDASDDRTVDLAKKEGAIVYSRKIEGDFSKQRNFGIEKAKGEWILFVDADERVPKALQNEIIYKLSKDEGVAGYFLKRQDFFKGKKLRFGETAHIALLRLGKKGKGEWIGNVHEVWDIKGKTAVLEIALHHFSHPTIDAFLRKINFYTDIRAKELFEKKVRVHGYDMILYPKVKFIQNYFLRMGFRDGVEGMVMALMMSFHSFLVRGKLWQLWDQQQKRS